MQPWTQRAQPAFSLSDVGGADIALNSYRGEALVVHFFATWCEPCREELPALNRLAARSDGRLKVLAISVAEVDLRVRRFLETLPLDFPVLLDRERKVAKAWNVATLPTTFVLDANLRARLFVEGEFDWDSANPIALSDQLAVGASAPAGKENSETVSNHRGG